MNFFDEIGVLALGTRLRMLSERMAKDAFSIYEMYGLELHPKWFPVFQLLSKADHKKVTDIAKEIGHSHASVSKIIKEMKAEGIIREGKDKTDARTTIVCLSDKGKALIPLALTQYKDVEDATQHALSQTQHSIWKAIEEWEYILDQQSLFHRVKSQKKMRESQAISIVPFEATHKQAFRDLNEEWISYYFTMEESDYKALDHPYEYIIHKGGYIFTALMEDEAVGFCALIKMEDQEYQFELAKMAVSPKVQGKGIGYKLGKAVIAQAKEAGATKVYLESNTKLKPALNLYKKLGFQNIPNRFSPYARCNVQMGIEV
ncbi:MAG: bifunctional helix-turn-helix transcriptional regulator/GNAT family N-acetyltransferase [Bacteroidota bacterium]